ncbi:RES domain-containing protein [Streptomyces nitrosporeus]|uniref:RES domain-containing protein n=2 Tax=Streptomyces nitrosporeus TaxID=28894 RepID=A0A5J6FJK3_9ACTN|nr:RES domain-containing protein [Streptomyces nitrosporeus]
MRGTPAKAGLPAGTLLHRVHAAHRSPVDFNPVPAHCLYGGGRFDATPCDGYGYLYAGLGAEAAVCEALLRQLPFDPAGGPRLLPRTAVEGRSLSVLRLRTGISLVSLMTAGDLAAVHQDTWLVHAEAQEYAYTRDWAHWIRRHTDPWAQGMVWSSKREPGDRAVVLFGDRCPPGALGPAAESTLELGTPDGVEWLNGVLQPYRVQLAP